MSDDTTIVSRVYTSRRLGINWLYYTYIYGLVQDFRKGGGALLKFGTKIVHAHGRRFFFLFMKYGDPQKKDGCRTLDSPLINGSFILHSS